jgi:hypothetical protein
MTFEGGRQMSGQNEPDGPAPCCDSMAMALDHGLVIVHEGELMLPLRPLTDINPDATAGNLLTGETYDASEFAVSMTVTFCPWCGRRLVATPAPQEYEGFNPFDFEALCDEDD